MYTEPSTPLSFSRARPRCSYSALSEKYPYPCIRGFHFANQFMAANAIYPTVLAAGAGKGSDTLFLDLGCMSKS